MRPSREQIELSRGHSFRVLRWNQTLAQVESLLSSGQVQPIAGEAFAGEDRKAFAGRLRTWLIDWNKGRAPEYERLSTEWFAQRVQMVIEFERTLLPHQRAIALGRLQDYIEDFTRLAQRPHSRTAAN